MDSYEIRELIKEYLQANLGVKIKTTEETVTIELYLEGELLDWDFSDIK